MAQDTLLDRRRVYRTLMVRYGQLLLLGCQDP